MTNFKSGSGDLDFGGSDEEDDEDDATGAASGGSESASASDSAPADAAHRPEDDSAPATESGSRRDPASASSDAADGDAGADAVSDAAGAEYPYFVRRNNVGDERERRLEVHVREAVAAREGEFRSELADRLGVSEVSKTDAREFALLAAYEHPERVAELMREEGFGALD